MYECKLYRLNIKGIKTKLEEDVLTLSVIPFVMFGNGTNCKLEDSTAIEKETEIKMELDTKSFYTETHNNLEALLKDLSFVQWFKTKNVIIEHGYDDTFETISVLSNTPDSIEMEDMLYFGYETDKEGRRTYFCNFNPKYFHSTQDCPFTRNAFVCMNKHNKRVIRKEAPVKEKKTEKKVEKEPEFYPSKKEALRLIPKEARKEGAHVWIKLSKSKPKMYTWVGGIEDKNLIVV